MIEQKNTILIFDEKMISNTENLSLSIDEPKPDSDNPILSRNRASHEESGVGFMGTIIYHKGKYKLWYIGWDDKLSHYVCYAESHDALVWEMPILGLESYRDCQDNNIVSGLPETDCCTVLLEEYHGKSRFLAPIMDLHGLRSEHVTKEQSKLLSSDPIGTHTLKGIMQSSDGKNWSLIGSDSTSPLIPEWLECCSLYKVGKRYIISGQQASEWAENKDRLRAGRCVSFWYSEDLKQWKKHPNSMQNKGQFYHTHLNITPIKQVGDMLVGLGGVFLTPNEEIPEQHFEIKLLKSHNGLDWTELQEGSSFIRRGRPGTWDAGGAEQGTGLVEIGDEAYIYYGGSDTGNLPVHGRTAQGHPAIGRVKFLKDRFAHLGLKVFWNFVADPENIQRHGQLTTKSILLSSAGLRLNVGNLSGKSFLTVALLNPDGSSVKEYINEECVPITENGVEIPVEWKNAPIPEGEYCVKINFHGGQMRMDSPYLYAIYY